MPEYRWIMAEEIGYVPQTTFWQDFSIADNFGLNAIKDTYNRAFKEWKDNVVYLTELVMVLNHKIWQWYNAQELQIAELYNDLWQEASAYALENLKGDSLSYYFRITD